MEAQEFPKWMSRPQFGVWHSLQSRDAKATLRATRRFPTSGANAVRHELMEIVLKPCGISPKDWPGPQMPHILQDIPIRFLQVFPVCAHSNFRPNSCNLNLYEDGEIQRPLHAVPSLPVSPECSGFCRTAA